MGEHYDAGCIRTLIFCLEMAPQYRLSADYREAIGRHLHADVTFRESAVVAPVDWGKAIGSQTYQGFHLRPKVAEIRIGPGEFVLAQCIGS